jgi:hypothetical protein
VYAKDFRNLRDPPLRQNPGFRYVATPESLNPNESSRCNPDRSFTILALVFAWRDGLVSKGDYLSCFSWSDLMYFVRFAIRSAT